MAITQSVLARAMARDVVRAAPPEAGIKRIWAWTKFGYIDPEREYVELSIMHEPNDEGVEQQFSRALASLHERFPEANILVHTFTPRDLDGLDPEGELRPGAEEITLVGE